MNDIHAQEFEMRDLLAALQKHCYETGKSRLYVSPFLTDKAKFKEENPSKINENYKIQCSNYFYCLTKAEQGNVNEIIYKIEPLQIHTDANR